MILGGDVEAFHELQAALRIQLALAEGTVPISETGAGSQQQQLLLLGPRSRAFSCCWACLSTGGSTGSNNSNSHGSGACYLPRSAAPATQAIWASEVEAEQSFVRQADLHLTAAVEALAVGECE